MSVSPSDHIHSNCSEFHESIESGLRLIEEYPECILIVGAKARYPEVEYGWIQRGRTPVDSLVNRLLRVSRRDEGNWRWRCTENVISDPAFEWLRGLTKSSNRLGMAETPRNSETVEVVA